MSNICEICHKSYQKGNLVPRGIGRRVTNRAIKKQKPNIRSKKVVVDGTPMKINICASCLKRMKFEQKKQAQKEAAQAA